MHFTVYSSVDVYLGHFQFRVTVNNAAITFLYVFWHTYEWVSVCCTPKTGSLGHIFKFRRALQRDFLSGCTSSRFHHQFMSVLVSLNTCQHLELSNFLIVAIMAGG